MVGCELRVQWWYGWVYEMDAVMWASGVFVVVCVWCVRVWVVCACEMYAYYRG